MSRGPAPAVAPVHTGVRGRARFRVAALRGRRRLAVHLEGRLVRLPAVRRVQASSISGSVLVLFDPAALDLTRLRQAIAAATRAHEDATAGPASAPWHALEAIDVLARLGSGPTGLSAVEAARRLAAEGGHVLPEPASKTSLQILRGHLTGVPVLVLFGAAAIALVSAAVAEASAILAVIAVNATVGWITERRVERVLGTLRRAGPGEATALRDGETRALPVRSLVRGDVIRLRAGQDVPADARLLTTRGLVMDESALTGESGGVSKDPGPAAADAPLAARRSMVYAGTLVTGGEAVAVVTGVGRDTVVGAMHRLLAETRAGATPLERQLDAIGRRLVLVSLGGCAVALALGLLRGVAPLTMLRTAISLGVAAVPEGLPAVATTTLALGTQQMARQGALVRRLAAVEALGATTVICADKTGTLTQNRMTVRLWHLGGRDWQVNGHTRPAGPLSGPSLQAALLVGVLCNEATLDGPGGPAGSSTEAALLEAARELGVDYHAVRAANPRRGGRPRIDGGTWMATVHDHGGERLIAVKGAPEEVLARSARAEGGGRALPLTAADRAEILSANARIAGRGMRVLGLAWRRVPLDAAARYRDLTWLGLVGLADPLRPGVRDAMAACRSAGIRIVVITGDQTHTAAAVCRDLDLVTDGPPRVVDAGRLDALDDATLGTLAREAHAFARVSPADKHRIVRALQSQGEVVAMTGDGINDAAALKAADVGVAMGARGTDVARDVADVVLTDDDFGALVRAIRQGRAIRDNLAHTLRFLLGTNLSEIALTIGALGLGSTPPLTALQYLWINLISDVAPALALALEPEAAGVMRRPPRPPDEAILSARALRGVAVDGATLAAAALAVRRLGTAGGGPAADAAAFSALAGGQLVHALTDGASGQLRAVVAASLGLQALAATAPPLRTSLGLAPLSAAGWALAAAGAVLPCVVRPLWRRTTAPSQPHETRRSPWPPSNAVPDVCPSTPPPIAAGLRRSPRPAPPARARRGSREPSRT